MNTIQIQSSQSLIFHVIPQGAGVPTDVRFQAFLKRDRWDDWAKYCTQFYLTIVDGNGVAHCIGNVKIGQFKLLPHPAGVKIPSGHRQPVLPTEFESLDVSFFALGQEEAYYENLAQLGDSIREKVLKSLHDVAFDSELWSNAKDEYVMKESLLRSITNTTVEGQYRRMANGGARLTRYSFSFDPTKRKSDGKLPFTLDFRVTPESKPPTNVHVLIGRNGVGKTRLLGLMTKALVAAAASARQSGSFRWENDASGSDNFSNLVTVSYSAFDDTELFPEGPTQEGALKYSYIGLHHPSKTGRSLSKPKSHQVLANEFIKSLVNCQIEPRRRRWLAALAILMSDPIFRSTELDHLIDYDLGKDDQKKVVFDTFRHLSSGHKIVLLTLTRLVETVEEKTLVLVDEIEAHLHPPLLSAFIRSLSNLLVDRNGVAIIASHSPVVLQEVPQTCVWILSRSIGESKAERPSIETFGENLGTLSREVFQLELSQSGFEKLLEEAVRSNPSYEDAVDSFDGHLGAEARAVLQALFLEDAAKRID